MEGGGGGLLVSSSPANKLYLRYNLRPPITGRQQQMGVERRGQVRATPAVMEGLVPAVANEIAAHTDALPPTKLPHTEMEINLSYAFTSPVFLHPGLPDFCLAVSKQTSVYSK